MGVIESMLLDTKARQEERKKTFGRIHSHGFDDTQHRVTISRLSDRLSDKTKDDEMGNVVKAEKENS